MLGTDGCYWKPCRTGDVDTMHWLILGNTLEHSWENTTSSWAHTRSPFFGTWSNLSITRSLQAVTRVFLGFCECWSLNKGSLRNQSLGIDKKAMGVVGRILESYWGITLSKSTCVGIPRVRWDFRGPNANGGPLGIPRHSLWGTHGFQ